MVGFLAGSGILQNMVSILAFLCNSCMTWSLSLYLKCISFPICTIRIIVKPNSGLLEALKQPSFIHSTNMFEHLLCVGHYCGCQGYSCEEEEAEQYHIVNAQEMKAIVML